MKAQVDFEFIFIIALILAVVLIVLGVQIHQSQDIVDTRDLLSKQSECNKAVDIFSSVYSAGDGASIRAEFDHLLTISNRSFLDVQDVREIIEVENDLAFLASDCGPTSQDFFDDLTSSLSLESFGVCYNGCGGSGCPGWYSTEGIADTLDNLTDNIYAYNVLYLEDPTLDYRDYKDLLEDWVAAGNTLVTSEHLFCRYTWWWWPSDYQCNYGEGSGDRWDAFGVEFNQEGGNYDNDVTVISEHNAFNLQLGEQMDFEEDSFIQNEDAEDFEVIATYDSNGEAAIVRWSYGAGEVYYFGDFQVDMLTFPTKEFSGVIVDLINIIYQQLLPGTFGDTECRLLVPVFDTSFTGSVSITNRGGVLYVENAT